MDFCRPARWLPIALGLVASIAAMSPVSGLDWFKSGMNQYDNPQIWGNRLWDGSSITTGSMVLSEAATREVGGVRLGGGGFHNNGFAGGKFLVRVAGKNTATSGRVRFPRPASIPKTVLSEFTAQFDYNLLATGAERDSNPFNPGWIYPGSGGVGFCYGDMSATGYDSRRWYDGYGGGLSVGAYYDSGSPGNTEQGWLVVRWKNQRLGWWNVSTYNYSGTPRLGMAGCIRVTVRPNPSVPGKHRLTVWHLADMQHASVGDFRDPYKVLETDIVFEQLPSWEFGFAGTDGALQVLDANGGSPQLVQRNGGAESFVRAVTIDATPMLEVGNFADANGPEGAKYEVSLPITDPNGQVAVSASSDNPGRIGAILVAGGKLSFTPPYSGGGDVTSTITVRFANGLVTKTFRYTVKDVDDVPTLDPIPDQKLRMNVVEPLELNLSGITAGPGDQQELRVFASSSDRAVIPDPTVVYASPNTTAKITLKPLAGQSGSVRITVTIRDAAGQSFQRAFNVAVASPTLVPPSDQIYDEDSGPHTLTITGIGDSRYEVVRGSYTWFAARDEAVKRGGRLASITSEEEWDAIKSADVSDADRYTIVSGSYTWEEARNDAHRRGGRLVIVNSTAKWNQIKNLLGGPLNTAGELWIGGERRDGKYYWMTGNRSAMAAGPVENPTSPAMAWCWDSGVDPSSSGTTNPRRTRRATSWSARICSPRCSRAGDCGSVPSVMAVRGNGSATSRSATPDGRMVSRTGRATGR